MHQENQEMWPPTLMCKNQHVRRTDDDSELNEKAQERAIMSTNTSNMSPDQKAWLVGLPINRVHHEEDESKGQRINLMYFHVLMWPD